MSRKLLALATLLAALGAACAPDVASFAPKDGGTSGPRFVPVAVDVRENAGVGLSMTVDAKGAPNISYFRVNEQEKLPPAPQPADPKFLPAVMLASLDSHGLWVRTIVAQEALNTDVVPTTPAPAESASPGASQSPSPTPAPSPTSTEVPPEPKFATLKATDNTDVAVDAAGHHHVAWTNGGAVQYATDAAGGFAGQPSDPIETVAQGRVSGLSIAVDASGTPWIAFYDGNAVEVATKTGGSWAVTEVAQAERPETAGRTDIVVSNGVPVVAFADGERTMAAAFIGGAWQPVVVDLDGGFGISIALAKDGSLLVAYYDGNGDVKVASSIDQPNGPPTWKIAHVTDEAGSPDVGWSTGVAQDGDGNTWAIWYDAKAKLVRYATAKGTGSFEVKDMPGGIAGQSPHLAMTADGARAAWYQSDTTSVTAGLFTGEAIPVALPSPPAPITGGGGTAKCSADGIALEITAPAGAGGTGFDTDCLAVAGGAAFSVHFVNDDATLHNFHVYTDSTAAQSLGGAKDATETVDGGADTTYPFEPLQAGSFFFRCDLHPTTMTGTFIVEAGGKSTGTPAPSASATPSPAAS